MIQFLEVFNSISGEVSPWHQGCLTTFVRLAKCNLSCAYCDTEVDKNIQFEEIEIFKEKINQKYQRTGRLCITGGEPLLQEGYVKYISQEFNNCWLETNGTFDFSEIMKNAGIVADYKLDTMTEIPCYFYKLRRYDFVKFVVKNKQDIRNAQRVQRSILLSGTTCNFAYSPIHGKMSILELFDTLISTVLPNTIINTQMHKYLGMK